MAKAAGDIACQPLWIDTTPGLTIADIRARIQRVVSRIAADGKPPLGFVAIDYLQLILAPASERRNIREQQVAAVSRELKQMALEFNVAFVVLSQLNRAVEGRQRDKRPLISDLRESGALEQDADTVTFIYRDDYYKRDKSEPRRYDEARSDRSSGIAELIVAKQRNGPTGTIKLKFTPGCTRFDDIETQ